MGIMDISGGDLMKIILFWVFFGIIVVLFIAQMINVIPVLRKGTSQEEKMKRQPSILMLNAVMMLFAGIMLMIGSNKTGAFVCGISIFVFGLLNLFVSLIRISSMNKKRKTE